MAFELKNLVISKYQEEEKEKHLLDQLFTSLSINVEEIKRKHPEADISHIEKCLENLTWKGVDYIKQNLTDYYNEDQLDIELTKALTKAKEYELDKRGVNTDINLETASIEKKRIVLRDILQELQWNFEVFRQTRSYINLIGKRVSIAFLALFIFFFLPDLMPNVARGMNIAPGEQSEYLYTAVITGMLGATFSKLLNLQKAYGDLNLNELRFAYKTSSILFRIFIGAGAGLVLFYLLEGHLLGGELFPNFPDNPNVVPFLDTKSKASLIILSFISGMSEKFIPSILSKVEKQE